jgi:hypothetical protein
MNHELTHATARVTGSILRIPDRLSTPQGAPARAAYARIFANCIAGHLEEEGWLYLSLPFQVALLTDPLLYIVAGGLLVLDHPTQSGQSQFALEPDSRTHTFDINRNWSLYENRHPRMISCARKGEDVRVGWMINQLATCDFRGPFHEGPSPQYAVPNRRAPRGKDANAT